MRTLSNKYLCALLLAFALFVSGPAPAGEAEWQAYMESAATAPVEMLSVLAATSS